MVILVIKIQKNINIIIIHKKINLNDHFTVPRLAEMEIGLGCKIGISQNWNPQNWREHCILSYYTWRYSIHLKKTVITYTENSSKETEVIEPCPEEAEAGRVSLSPLALALVGLSSVLICSEGDIEL